MEPGRGIGKQGTGSGRGNGKPNEGMHQVTDDEEDTEEEYSESDSDEDAEGPRQRKGRLKGKQSSRVLDRIARRAQMNATYLQGLEAEVEELTKTGEKAEKIVAQEERSMRESDDTSELIREGEVLTKDLREGERAEMADDSEDEILQPWEQDEQDQEELRLLSAWWKFRNQTDHAANISCLLKYLREQQRDAKLEVQETADAQRRATDVDDLGDQDPEAELGRTAALECIFGQGVRAQGWLCGSGDELTRKMEEQVEAETRHLPSAANNVLWAAAAVGNATAVRRLVEEGGAEVSSSDAWVGNMTALHRGAAHGHTRVVRELMRLGAMVDAVETNSGCTPLHLAARAGHLATVRTLVAGGAGVNVRCGRGMTALEHAVACLLQCQMQTTSTSRPSLAEQDEEQDHDQSQQREEAGGGGGDWMEELYLREAPRYLRTSSDTHSHTHTIHALRHSPDAEEVGGWGGVGDDTMGDGEEEMSEERRDEARDDARRCNSHQQPRQPSPPPEREVKEESKSKSKRESGRRRRSNDAAARRAKRKEEEQMLALVDACFDSQDDLASGDTQREGREGPEARSSSSSKARPFGDRKQRIVGVEAIRVRRAMLEQEERDRRRGGAAVPDAGEVQDLIRFLQVEAKAEGSTLAADYETLDARLRADEVRHPSKGLGFGGARGGREERTGGTAGLSTLAAPMPQGIPGLHVQGRKWGGRLEEEQDVEGQGEERRKEQGLDGMLHRALETAGVSASSRAQHDLTALAAMPSRVETQEQHEHQALQRLQERAEAAFHIILDEEFDTLEGIL